MSSGRCQVGQALPPVAPETHTTDEPRAHLADARFARLADDSEARIAEVFPSGFIIARGEDVEKFDTGNRESNAL